MVKQQPPSTKPPSPPQNQVVTHQVQQWAGPLPPPATLEHFERIIPGGADRILQMAEREQAHRVACDSSVLTAAIAEARRGQFLGAAVAMAAIAAAVANTWLGGPWQATVALVGVPILGIVQALIGRRAESEQEKPKGQDRG